MALKYNYPESIAYKLYLRSAQCFYYLHKKNLMKENLYKLQESLEKNSLLIGFKKGILFLFI